MLTCHPQIRGPFPKILPPLAEGMRRLGCEVVEAPWGRHREEEGKVDKVFGRLGDLRRLRGMMRSKTFDLLLLHSAHEWANFSRDLPLLWLSRGRVPRVAIQWHGSYPDQVMGTGNGAFKRATRAVLNRAHGVLLLSSEEKRHWELFHPRGRYYVVNNAFIPATGKPLPAGPLPWSLPTGVPVVLFAGRLIAEKGVFDLMEAMALLRPRLACHLLFAGSGPTESDLKQRATQLGLENDVTFGGYLTGDTLVRAYQAASVFTLPSWAEGMPVVITEAMAAGKAIVTTRLRGAVDHLREGEHAFFVPPRDPTALAAALEKVLRDPALQLGMGEANRQKVQDFAPDKVARHYLSVLQEIMTTGPARS